jgi:hypothetical protein
MYFSVFSSSEYYSDEDRDCNTHRVDEDDLCLICWLPGDTKNEVKLLTDFSHIKPKCKCKPKIHTLCINEWIKKSPTCPICRTNMNIIIFTTDGQNIFINCYINCISYTICLLRILCYASFLNLFLIIFYNTYFIYFMVNSYHQDDYGIY